MKRDSANTGFHTEDFHFLSKVREIFRVQLIKFFQGAEPIRSRNVGKPLKASDISSTLCVIHTLL